MRMKRSSCEPLCRPSWTARSCLRQETPLGTMLVFPSYFRRDKPDLPEHPNVFVTYGFSGPLEEIYATLVVRLSYSDGFKCEQLWKDAVDFKTPSGKRVGLAMRKKSEGAAEIVVYFEAGVPDDTKVTFIKYVHEHLLARAQPREEVTRVQNLRLPALRRASGKSPGGSDSPVQGTQGHRLSQCARSACLCWT